MTITTAEPQTIAEELLARVRAVPGCADAAYAEAPEEIVGGYDTSIFSFRLAGVAAPWDGPLILRLFRAAHVDRPRIETAIQNTVVDMGYPCPRALLDGGDGRIGGRPYMIMEQAAALVHHVARAHDATRDADPRGGAHASARARRVGVS